MKNKKLLLICWFNPNAYSMVVHHIKSIQKKSYYDIDIFNLFDSVISRCEKSFFRKVFTDEDLSSHQKINISNYAGYIIHNTISYDINNVLAINERFSPILNQFEGFKVLMKQDESLNTNLTYDLLKNWDFNLFLTCIPKDQWDIHFASKVSSSLRVMHMLTGYVEDRMRNFKFSQDDYRPVDIFYRGMLLPYFFGKLSYEKYSIGESFKKICSERGFLFDISSDTEDRLHGDDWFNALADSKGVLAVESGASIFDWDGSLQKQVECYMAQYPDALFDEVWEKFLKPFDGIINYAQISPRHFEAAATRTVQIMFEGVYSNIFIPDTHFISLKKDFSNLDEVLEKFKSKTIRKRITEASFEDIILNKKYSYNVFIKEFDRNLALI